MSIKEQLDDLQKAIHELRNICAQLGLKEISSNDTEFLKSIINEFKENNCFTLSYLQGLSKPHKEYHSRYNLDKKCYQTKENNKEFPHLKHTFNTQLNHIVDMLEEILDSTHCQCKEDKRKEIIPIDPSYVKSLEDKIKQLEENPNRCLTLGDLQNFISKQNPTTRSQPSSIPGLRIQYLPI